MGTRSGAQAGRWLAILDRLAASKRGMTIAELAEEFDCASRTVYRDIGNLQERLGAPLVCDRDDGNADEGAARWRLMDGSRYARASVEFTPSELLALLAAGRLLEPFLETPYGAGLKSLQAKVRGRLAEAATRFVEADGASLGTSGVARFDYRRHAGTIETLRRSIRERRTLEMTYRSLNSGKETRRRLDPYRLWYSEGTLYVVGGCHVHDKEARTFAVDRIREPALLAGRFEIPAGFRWEDFVRDSFRVFHGEVSTVEVDFSEGIAPLIRDRVWHPSQTIKPVPVGRSRRARRGAKAGGVRLTMRVAGLFEVTQWILGFGANARAVSPPALVASVRREIAGMANRYATSSGVSAGKARKRAARPRTR